MSSQQVPLKIVTGDVKTPQQLSVAQTMPSPSTSKGGPIRKNRRQSQQQEGGRTHEENQERAYIAASRRNDRSIEARLESARRASEIHKKRCGRGLRITEEAVLHEEMDEEEDPDYEQRLSRIRDFRLGLTPLPRLYSFSPYPVHMLPAASQQYNSTPTTPKVPTYQSTSLVNPQEYAGYTYQQMWANSPSTPQGNGPASPLSPGGHPFNTAGQTTPTVSMSELTPSMTHIFLPPTQFAQHTDGSVSRKEAALDRDMSAGPPAEAVAPDPAPFDLFSDLNFEYTDDGQEQPFTDSWAWNQSLDQHQQWAPQQ